MVIELLGIHPEYVDSVIDLQYRYVSHHESRKMYESIVKHSLTEDRLPVAFIALDGTALAGTVSVWRTDILSRQDLTPWLASLVVAEGYRNKGVGYRLQQFVQGYCKEKGYPALYLNTEHEGYYECAGWEYIGQGVEHTGAPVRLYRKWLQAE